MNEYSQIDVEDDVVRDYFVDVSEGWSERYGARPRKMSDLDLVLRRENAQHLLLSCTASIHAPVKVLDLGCGTGNALDGIARNRFRISGLDPVPEMIRIAAETHPEDAYIVGQIENLNHCSSHTMNAHSQAM